MQYSTLAASHVASMKRITIPEMATMFIMKSKMFEFNSKYCFIFLLHVAAFLFIAWSRETNSGLLLSDVTSPNDLEKLSPALLMQINAISFPEPANFLRRMLDENEGSGKDQFLGDPDWLSEM